MAGAVVLAVLKAVVYTLLVRVAVDAFKKAVPGG